MTANMPAFVTIRMRLYFRLGSGWRKKGGKNMFMNWLRFAPLAFLAVFGFAPRVIAQDSPFDIYFAFFAGGEGYSTTVTLVNTGTTAATGFLLPRDSLGRPLTARQMSVPPHGVSRFTIGGSGGSPLLTGWATYSGSGGKVSGFATIEQSGVVKSAVAELSSKPSLSVTIPAGFIVPLERYTAFALANPGTADVTVRIAVYSAEGIPAAEPFTLTLGAGQMKAQFLFESLPDPVIFDGTMVVTSESGDPFLAMAMSWIKGSLAMIPVQEN
jgi:hypothetical protein